MATQKKTGNLKELYKKLVIEHARKPQNFGCMELHSDSSKGVNPLCGDKIKIYILQEKGHISKISFEGVGCAISIASASLLTETLKNQSVAQAKKYAKNFIMIMNSNHESSENKKQFKVTPELPISGARQIYGLRERRFIDHRYNRRYTRNKKFR